MKVISIIQIDQNSVYLKHFTITTLKQEYSQVLILNIKNYIVFTIKASVIILQIGVYQWMPSRIYNQQTCSYFDSLIDEILDETLAVDPNFNYILHSLLSNWVNYCYFWQKLCQWVWHNTSFLKGVKSSLHSTLFVALKF